MTFSKVFYSGNSQAVRIPKEHRFNSDEVEIIDKGDYLIIRECPKTLEQAFELFASLPQDALDFDRNDMPPQERDFF